MLNYCFPSRQTLNKRVKITSVGRWDRQKSGGPLPLSLLDRNKSYFAHVNCKDIDDIFEEYRQRNVEFTQGISNKPWGLREFGVRTPEGHRIMFGE